MRVTVENDSLTKKCHSIESGPLGTDLCRLLQLLSLVSYESNLLKNVIL